MQPLQADGAVAVPSSDAGPREVEFHIGVDDKPGYACRLLRKVVQRGLRAVVTGSPEALGRLDQLLWTFDPGSFVPHARLRRGERPAAVLQRTPIWLADEPQAVPGPEDGGAVDVLVNLGPEMATQLDGYARLVELVGDDEADLQSGRQRWRAHKAAGLSPRDMRQPGASAG